MKVDVAPDLPPLAWVATLENDRLHVTVGQAVETLPDGLFEGAWSGDFGEGDILSAQTVCGSGVVIREGEAHFVPPSHNLEAIYYQEIGDRTVASNSLAFLIVATGCDPLYDRNFGARIATVSLGLKKYEPVVLQTDLGPIRRAVFDNLVFTGGKHRTEPKPTPPALRSFSEYRSALVHEMSSVFANASDRRRKCAYRPLGTCSSGYDSTMCTVLAREIGCERFASIVNSRSGEDDSGTAVASALGIQLQGCERMSRIDSEAIAAEFMANGTSGEDAILVSFDDLLPNSILVTGFQGDKMWDRDSKPENFLVRSDVSATSLTEYRIRTNFIHLPVPFIHARNHSDITAISRSVEMEPWSIGGTYDRPIARRIAEEAGIPRDAFAHSKKAVSLLSHHKSSLLPESFMVEVRKRAAQLPFGSRAIFSLRRRLGRKRLLLSHILHKLGPLSPIEFLPVEHNRPEAFFQFEVALSMIRDRYSDHAPTQR